MNRYKSWGTLRKAGNSYLNRKRNIKKINLVLEDRKKQAGYMGLVTATGNKCPERRVAWGGGWSYLNLEAEGQAPELHPRLRREASQRVKIFPIE